MQPCSRDVSAIGRAGYSLAEMIIALLLSTIVLAAVFQMVFAQNKAYGTQQGMAEARQSLRAAGTLLAWELRHASAGGGDLYLIDSDSVSLRSFDGIGVVCRKRPAQDQYGLTSVSGPIEPGDSAVIYAVNTNRTVDDIWRVVNLVNAGTPAGLGINSTCEKWTGTVERAVQVDVTATADTAGVRIGAPVRSFHRRTYRMIQRNDLWWLGVREGNGAYGLLTGPLREDDGLELRFMDASGSPTAVPGDVASVEFVLRAEGVHRSSVAVPEDSVVMRVELRG